MKDETIIEIKGLGKKYHINHEQGGYVALRDVITNIFKHPFAFLKDKAKTVTGLKSKEEFWALKDISLEVKRGEVMGIIGANGAGKSTLLKILTSITPPTEGEAILRGRVSSLLEVGTGFHPELTGRENIFLNGAILGMKRKEITKKFDEIVGFAGIEKFLDTPVKYYSSGMYVRLAFSVAAHMEPDVLLVDEVLAVGDAEFQKKCIGKMEEVTRKTGRTILFVSHNMAAIKKLCSKTLVLSKGKAEFFGNTEEAVQFYMRNIGDEIDSESLAERTDRRGKGNIIINNVSFEDTMGQKIRSAVSGTTLVINLAYSAKSKKDELHNCRFAVSFKNFIGERLFVCATDLVNTNALHLPPEGIISCVIENFPLTKGEYIIDTFLQIDKQVEDHVFNAAKIEVENGDFYGTGATPTYWEGVGVLVKHKWRSKT